MGFSDNLYELCFTNEKCYARYNLIRSILFTSMRHFDQTFGVVGALLERDERFLLVREHRNGDHPDHDKWNQPAGWIDVGEDPRDTAIREVKEETGCLFTPTHIVGVFSLVREDLREQIDATPHAIKVLYTGTFNETDAPLDTDISETAWFTPTEVQEMDKTSLRDTDIPAMIERYQNNQLYPLEVLHHHVCR